MHPRYINKIVELYFVAAWIVLLLPLAVAQSCVPTKDLSWVSIGDWGMPGYQQRRVVHHMAIEAANVSAQFALLLGDNFYPDGVTTWKDGQFVSTYENVFSASSLQIPHFAVLGNHDYHQIPQAQVERHHNVTSRWTMPHRWYSREFAINCQSQKTASALFVFIDTMMLSEGSDNGMFHKDDVTQEGRQEHWSWLEKVLREATADWIIVVGHHPVYSSGRHGNTKQLVSELKPLLDCHGVDAYFAGHDHDLQMLSDGQDSPVYIVSGSGSKLRRMYSRPYRPQTQFAESVPGFVSTRLNGTHIQNFWISDAGVVVHKHVQLRRKKQQHGSCRSAMAPAMDGHSDMMQFGAAVALLFTCLAACFLVKRCWKWCSPDHVERKAMKDPDSQDHANIYGAGAE